MRRRHLDVHDRHVRLCDRDFAQQRFAVADLLDDIDAGVLEQAHDAFAGEHRVLRDDYPHGISARCVMPTTLIRPPSAPTRSARCTDGDDAMGSRQTTSAWPSRLTVTSRWSAAASAIVSATST